MNMPGFTAEASLDTMSEGYQETATLRAFDTNAVRPASCYSECVHECIWDRGHPRPGSCIRICRLACARD